MFRNLTFRSIVLLVFLSFFYWDFFSIEQSIRNLSGVDDLMSMEQKKFPAHRYFLTVTFIILMANFKIMASLIKDNMLLFVMIVYQLVATIWAFDAPYSLRLFALLFATYAISIMTALAYQENKLRVIRYFFWLFFLLVLASIAVAMLFPQYGVASRGFGKARWIGVTGHPNKLGSLGVACVWVAINLHYLSKRFIEKILALFAVVCSLFVIKMADSMTSMFTSLGVIGYAFYIYWIGTKSVGVRVVFIGFCSLALLVVTIFYMSASDIMNVTLKSSGRNATLTGRSIQWAAVYEAIKDNPVLGMGFDDLKPLTRKTHIDMGYIHNGYLSLLVRGGAIAGLLFAAILINSVLRLLAIRNKDIESFAFISTGLAGILVYNMAESSIFVDLSGLNILMFFILVLTNQIYFNLKSIQTSNQMPTLRYPNIGIHQKALAK